MLVYRFEHKNGIGPYCQFDLSSKKLGILNTCLDPRISNRHPSIKCSKLRDKYGLSVYFGCSSLESLFEWFNDKEREGLKQCGFNLNVYDCPNKYVYAEEKQLIFVKDKSKFVQTLSY